MKLSDDGARALACMRWPLYGIALLFPFDLAWAGYLLGLLWACILFFDGRLESRLDRERLMGDD